MGVPADILRDTYNMAIRAGQDLEPIFALRNTGRIWEVHDELQESVNNIKYTYYDYPDETENSSILPDAEVGPGTITRMRNTNELREEGRALHHCVAGYNVQCNRRTSIVYSVKMEDGERATLELNYYGRKVQLRGPCNGQPSRKLREFVDEWMAGPSKFQKSEETENEENVTCE